MRLTADPSAANQPVGALFIANDITAPAGIPNDARVVDPVPTIVAVGRTGVPVNVGLTSAAFALSCA